MRLNQVTLEVKDIEPSKAFYKTLGLKIIVDGSARPGEHYARFMLPDGEATLSLYQSSDATASNNTLYFECDNLDAAVEALRSKGIEFEHDPVDQPWLWREAALRDPDGHHLCLFDPGDNRLNPPWRVKD